MSQGFFWGLASDTFYILYVLLCWYRPRRPSATQVMFTSHCSRCSWSFRIEKAHCHLLSEYDYHFKGHCKNHLITGRTINCSAILKSHFNQGIMKYDTYLPSLFILTKRPGELYCAVLWGYPLLWVWAELLDQLVMVPSKRGLLCGAWGGCSANYLYSAGHASRTVFRKTFIFSPFI